ncbi:MADS-box domain-containing protein [Heracleum sosnowskyi]|uniref:MADS-box domain-containing protein n=1 Tax=Heracleum sosnowskyi TaxID=360622 RepID=A0AAD8ILX4_9APIA|nr:MADS-box domain-containing protein [Heracleum sosnowskyi]
MGRAKSNMEFITKETLRNRTFQQKNNTLKKKVYELATLCDVKVALIVYGPRKDTPQAHPLEPEIWPQNRDEVLELINKYKGQSPEDCKTRTSLLSHFFNEKIKKAQQDLIKQRNDNVQSKYPTWHSSLDSLKEENLRKSVVSLDNVIGDAKAKLEQMKANNIYRANEMLKQQQQQQQQRMMMSKKRKMDSDAGNQAHKYPKIDPQPVISDPGRVPFPIHQQWRPFIDHNRNQMMVNFGNEYARGMSNIVHNAAIHGAFYNYPTMAGTPASISDVNNLARAPPNYYVEDRQPISQYVMAYRPMTEGSNSYQMASNQYYEDRKWLR